VNTSRNSKRRQPVQGTKRTRFILGNKVRRRSISQFTRQLATMLQSGVPLVRSLEILERQQKEAVFRQIIHELAQNVRSGNPLSDGLALYPKVFNDLYCHMVRAGEASGLVPDVLGQLATFMEKSQKTQSKIVAALMYPAVVLSLAFLILGGLMVFVVPRFEAIYEDFLRGAALPKLTQVVLDLSEFVQSNVLLILLVFLFALVGSKLFSNVEKGKFFIDSIKLRLPVFGALIRINSITRFSRTLGTLIGSAVPLLESLSITSAVVGNKVYQRELQKVFIRVRDGDPISRPLAEAKHFPEMLCGMIEVGEETGKVPEMLHKVADSYEDDLDTAVSSLTSALEPIMIVLMAVVVGTIVIALFLPLIGIFQNLAV
jgi:type IV pilus assembly protein PilC